MNRKSIKMYERCTGCKKNFDRCSCFKNKRPLIGLVSAFTPELSNLQNVFTVQLPSVDHGGRLFLREF